MLSVELFQRGVMKWEGEEREFESARRKDLPCHSDCIS